jgi:hypothetical protein
LKKFIKKPSKKLKLTRKDSTPEPYRCAGLKLTNKYNATYPYPKRPYSLTEKAKKSKKFLDWFFGVANSSDPLAHPAGIVF